MTHSPQVQEILAQSPLFQGLGAPELEALAAVASLRSLPKGETLFLEGDPVHALFIVARGVIKVYKMDPQGRRQIVLHLEGPYHAVAAVAVFLEKPHYPACAEALEDSLLLAIPTEAFQRLLETHPALSRALIRFLARRQGQLVHLLDRLVFHEVAARLAEYLLGRLEAEGQGFSLPTNPELAALLGTVPEAVSRKLGELFRRGLIRLAERRVWIDDPAALREVAEA
ncbi:Crp/Fnr family transcriptional regulator [Calidithermus timidus]|jgi:CRP-like cAMP-binding protein|uniref:Crp/Fnr family transcriptional regulator n=1 Tax=Calidithermus timidus TaxID=307124 RepID=UPI000372A057|nr:Crp/Fnr family transcriptional regulator [Calidithermus timidus]MCL6441386.1 Crp/Fnr family transcriptional regulator [Thermoleophilum sp.]